MKKDRKTTILGWILGIAMALSTPPLKDLMPKQASDYVGLAAAGAAVLLGKSSADAEPAVKPADPPVK